MPVDWNEYPSLYRSIAYGTVLVPQRVAVRMTCSVAEVDPVRRRRYLRGLEPNRRYQNMSRAKKTLLRRAYLCAQVPRD